MSDEIEGHGGVHALAVARAHGVETMFTLSGAHVFPIYDAAVTSDPPTRILDVRHEQTATFAAEATGKLTRRPGLAVLTAGPGVTNGVSAMAQAAFSGAPMVVIGGLGMGWFLHEVAQRKQVKKITIVEKDEELIAWYGNALAKKYNAEIVCADIYDVYRDFSKETRFLLDIWPAWFDATGDRKLRKMRAEGFNVWAWGSPRGLES